MVTLNAYDALGIAATFNTFVQLDHHQWNTDCEGRVAVGGKATYDNYGVGDRLVPDRTRDDLVVGTTMDIGQGSNAAGNSVLQTPGNMIRYQMNNPNGTLIERSCPIAGGCIDFTAEFRKLTDLATQLKTYADPPGEDHIGTIALTSWGSLELTGTCTDYNVFVFDGVHINGSNWGLHNLTGLNFNCLESASTLLIVLGTSLALRNYEMRWNGGVFSDVALKHIMWVMPECTQLTIESFSGRGALLAPQADLIFNNGQYNGNVMVKSIYGSGEIHNYLYNGIIPDVSPKKLCSIAGIVWDDFNRNGVVNSGEKGVPLATVKLMQGDVVLRTLQTDEEGGFLFADVEPGTYHIVYEIPSTHQAYEFVTVGGWVDDKGHGPSFSVQAGEIITNRNCPIATERVEVHKRAFTNVLGSVQGSEHIWYEIDLINYGNEPLQQLHITDSLDPQVTYDNNASFILSGETRGDLLEIQQVGTQLIFTIANLPDVTSGVIVFSVTNKSLTAGQHTTNKATLTYTFDQVQVVKVTEETKVTYTNQILRIEKYADDYIRVGETMWYRFVVANDGEEYITGGCLQDALPFGFMMHGIQEGHNDVKALITIREGCLNPSQNGECPTLVEGGVVVTEFEADLYYEQATSSNRLTITGLNIPYTGSCHYGLLIEVPGKMCEEVFYGK